MYATPQLSNSIDDINDFDVPAFVRGDIVRFEPFYESDEGGVGVIKQITNCEFKNKNYDPQDENSPLFISLPCAIVVSILPNEKWLDYVPLHLMETLLLSELIEEIANAIPEYDAIDLWSVRIQIARVLSDYRSSEWLDSRYMSSVPAHNTIVPFQANGGVL